MMEEEVVMVEEVVKEEEEEVKEEGFAAGRRSRPAPRQSVSRGWGLGRAGEMGGERRVAMGWGHECFESRRKCWAPCSLETRMSVAWELLGELRTRSTWVRGTRVERRTWRRLRHGGGVRRGGCCEEARRERGGRVCCRWLCVCTSVWCSRSFASTRRCPRK
jgi:hypothetical protein